MASFQKAQSEVKVFEGGYTDNPKDRGNYVCNRSSSGYWATGSEGNYSCSNGGKVLVGTNHGISAPVLSDYLGRKATVGDMKNLSYNTALSIYKRLYWDPLALDKIESDSIALIIYDGAVNQGVGRMKQITKDIVGSSLPSYSAIKEINKSNQKTLFEQIKEERKKYYSKGSAFYEGWMNRLSKITFSDVKRFARENTVPLIITTLGIIGATTLLVINKSKFK